MGFEYFPQANIAALLSSGTKRTVKDKVGQNQNYFHLDISSFR
jgi:hypothetical protein